MFPTGPKPSLRPCSTESSNSSFDRIGTDGPLVIQTLGEIQRISDAHRTAGNLVGPHLKMTQVRCAIDGRESTVDGVLTRRHFNPANSRRVKACIGRKPLTTEIDLRISVEI